MPPRKKLALKEGEQLLRLYVNGAIIEIISPIPREQFLQEMVNDINTNGMKPEWSGWYSLRSSSGGIISVRIRCIDAVEEID
tara:strand:- start:145 stop:390 length:246 start_codon:yes stop_codon:yes gene_type:complete